MAARHEKRQVSALNRKDKARIFAGACELVGMIVGGWVLVLLAVWGVWALPG